jgi:hypothetical protein
VHPRTSGWSFAQRERGTSVRRILGCGLALFVTATVAVCQVDPKIINGMPTSGFPSVGLLAVPFHGCTATLIGCQTVLTAAHCVCSDPNSGNLLNGSDCNASADVQAVSRRFLLQHGGEFEVSHVEADPDFAFPDHDLAVLHLNQPVTGIAPSAINTLREPVPGTPATIVGFGYDSRAFGGLKNFGRVALARCSASGISPDHLCWEFKQPIGSPGSNSTTCFGDSGGPLFIESSAGPVLSGVHSGASGAAPDDCITPTEAFDADVFSDSTWIVAQGGADLRSAACGGLPAAGTKQAPILGGMVSVTPRSPRASSTFRVPRGTKLLRVAINGQLNGSTYELYLNPGAPAGPNRFSCKSVAAHRGFQFCEVSAPSAGAWNVLVRLAGGFGGLVQQTVTLYTSANHTDAFLD